MRFQPNHKVALLTSLIAATSSVLATESVTTGLSADDMVALLIGGSGITITPGSAVYTGAPAASGSFSGFGADSGLPFSSGLLLTSGFAANAIGPNKSDGITGVNGTAGIPADIQAAIPHSGATFDAAMVSFKFKSSLDKFSFSYVFGSDEYNEYAPSPFNDVFAFILTDAAGASENLAKLPDGSIVSINNVNLGTNADYFRDNDLSSGLPSYLNIEYDGLVGINPGKELAAVGSVTPGVEYTITMVIADTSDQILDSGVFLKQGSFVAGPPQPTDVPEASTSVAGAFLGILGGYAVLRRRNAFKA